jgi:two-component system chemotaxis response regulator CheB
MPGHDIIVVGASAGGVEALSQLVADLPQELSAAIFVVIHISAHSKSFLPQILSCKGILPAAHAVDGEVIQNGRIYIAPPDYHLLVKPGYVRLTKGPKENSFRPAIDPLFRTAAKAYRKRVVGVILSGTLDDGTAGLMDVKRFGGVAVVQDPKDALYRGMPTSAIENVEVNYILPVSSIASTLVRLANELVVDEGLESMPNESEIEPDIVELDGAAIRRRGHPGEPSNFTCPDCGGTLYQLNERDLLQYRCRTGHAFSSGTLMELQSQVQEDALWAAIRSLEERGELMQQMANKAQESKRLLSAKRYTTMAIEAQQRADLIRQALFQGHLPATIESNVTEESNQNQEQDVAFPIVVLVASAREVNALSQILRALPQTFPAAVIVMQDSHIQANSSLMAELASRPATLPLKLAQEGERIQPSIIYIAPPTPHLLVNPNGTLSLSQAVFVDFMRPSVELLLQSVAATFQERAIAVVLSGTDSSGVSGVEAIKKMGGKVIAQDEDTSECFEMPNAAIQTGKVDFVLSVSAIASTLVKLCQFDSGSRPSSTN